jgi:uncharacterized protein DUF4112
MKHQDRPVPKELEGIDNFSKLLDSKFRIPGTNIRFGVDFIIGLVPYGGDLISFLLSAGLIITMARYSVSGQVLGKMILNVVLDTVIGSIPIIGDLFDLFFKANRRNYHLLEKHYGEGKYQGSIWRVVIPLLLVLLFTLFLMFWLILKVMWWIWEFLFM